MIEGINHTPDQSDSHAELQARQGWSVASMRQEIEQLKETLYNSRQFWSEQNQTLSDKLNESRRQNRELKQALDAKERLLGDYRVRHGNDLEFLQYVSCGNISEGFLRSGISELKSVRDNGQTS